MPPSPTTLLLLTTGPNPDDGLNPGGDVVTRLRYPTGCIAVLPLLLLVKAGDEAEGGNKEEDDRFDGVAVDTLTGGGGDDKLDKLGGGIENALADGGAAVDEGEEEEGAPSA